MSAAIAKRRAATPADLKARAKRARAQGAGSAATDRARRMLAAYLDTAERHGLPPAKVLSDMASGRAAWQIGTALRDEMLRTPPEAVKNAACAAGCAFCCILSGGDGGTITETEARRLHDALAPLAGQPDGRGWHPAACAALDPETRACRAYDARPMICRSFLSTDAGACRINSEGGEAKGAGLLGTHLDYLALHALARETLKGISRVATYSMSRIASGAVDGETAGDSLDAARHKPGALEDACRDAARAAVGRG
ncbi:YkgJ family cysteine cluster protein [Pseudoruegeria sp. HB172150]|uniref:YkgJ family cysteine cluster protein n=1 Tax=Pseudoruegeria sp. HB172150 TaxID=2721164 RepID=UPI0015570C7F|nr:YkgJ family cysteine cluster protein [Pseudoruegeria sp. HB172150]